MDAVLGRGALGRECRRWVAPGRRRRIVAAASEWGARDGGGNSTGGHVAGDPRAPPSHARPHPLPLSAPAAPAPGLACGKTGGAAIGEDAGSEWALGGGRGGRR